MKTSKYIILGCLLFGVGLGLGIVFFYFRSSTQRTEYVTEATSQQPTVSPLPVITQLTQATETSWPSPDGKVFLKMTTKPETSSEIRYSFFVSKTATESGQLVFEQTNPTNTFFSIPFNTWSPDNKLFFIQEHHPDLVRNLVFKASGQPFASDAPFLDVNAEFENKKSGFVFGEVTGWAAPTLLIVNTKSVDDKTSEVSVGASFWFETSRKSLTRLSSTFP